MLLLTKDLATRYPVGELLFFRNFWSFMLVIGWLIADNSLGHNLMTQDIAGHAKRCIAGGSGTALTILALSYLSVTEATALNYAMPLFTVLLAAWLLRERVGMARWVSVSVGFIGVLLMMMPHFSSGISSQALRTDTWLGVSAALSGAFLNGLAQVQVRQLTKTERSGTILLYYFGFTGIATIATTPIGWVLPGLLDATLLTLMGLAGGLTQILMVQSMRFAEASLLATFEYTLMIWVCVAGWLAYSELPSAHVVTGAFIVAAAGCFVTWFERRKRCSQA